MAQQDHILNVKKVHERMKNKPVRYRLYNFFNGMPDMLSLEQMIELKKIANQESKKLLSSLDKKIKELQKQQKKSVQC